MNNRIFGYSAVEGKHRRGLLGTYFDRFVSWMQDRGYSRNVMQIYVRNVTNFSQHLQRMGIHSMGQLKGVTGQEKLRIAYRRYCKHYGYENISLRSLTYNPISGVNLYLRVLGEAGVLTNVASRSKASLLLETQQYVTFLRNQRNLSEGNICNHIYYVEKFLLFIGYKNSNSSIPTFGITDIDRFIEQEGARLKHTTVQRLTSTLRSFLRFLYQSDKLRTDLSNLIISPRQYKLQSLPRVIDRSNVQKLLDSVDRSTKTGIRDYTILVLLATYGLRRGEVASLTLDDIDWRNNILRVPQQKTNNQLLLPLTDIVAKVLIEYLRKSRPNHLPYRQLFLKSCAPSGSLSPQAISDVFERRVLRSGVQVPCLGPHCLRHAHATHLLHQGTSLKVIGDLLGHRRPETTYGYLRLAVEDLRGVALPVPKGPSVTTPLDTTLSKYRLSARVRSLYVHSHSGENMEKYRRTCQHCGEKFIPITPRDLFCSERCRKKHRKAQKKKNDYQRIYSPKEQRRDANSPTKHTESFRSFLREEFRKYLQFKRSLGRDHIRDTYTFHSLDSFLAKQYPLSRDLTAEMFNQWCVTFCHCSSAVRQRYMSFIRDFCLYRRRSRPRSFVPDSLTFPDRRQPMTPHIFSESDIARLLSATKYLRPLKKASPIRSQTFYIAILLLYTNGLRHRELLRLKLDDYNSAKKILSIKNTKFHKSRIIPLSSSVAAKLDAFLELRLKNHLPMDVTSPLIWNGMGISKGRAYTQAGLDDTWHALCTELGIFTKEGKPPRIHDLRHSFAVNVLQRWYHAGEDVQAKLPMLSTFMGHKEIRYTYYYLQFIEGIRSEASARFQQKFGSAVTIADPNS